MKNEWLGKGAGMKIINVLQKIFSVHITITEISKPVSGLNLAIPLAYFSTKNVKGVLKFKFVVNIR
jgi:hypothetical protein